MKGMHFKSEIAQLSLSDLQRIPSASTLTFVHQALLPAKML
jgi:hypothetical protein